MALREYEFYHGAALSRLISIADSVQIKKLDDIAFGCYVVNGEIGLLIKYATDRMTPWAFTFTSEHKRALSELKLRYAKVLVLLVCRNDGIVALDYDSALTVIGDGPATAAVSVSRKPRQMYAVSGTNGALSRKLGDADFARQVVQPLNADTRT